MEEKISAVEAAEKTEKLIVELKMALDSAERYHQLTKARRFSQGGLSEDTMPSAEAKQSADTDENTGEDDEPVFKAHRVRHQLQTPEEHDLRMKHCTHNRETITKLNDRVQDILNDYQADLKDHHKIDEGARLLEIVQAVDGALTDGHWQQGLFFRTIGEKLKKTRELFHEHAMLWHAHVQTKEEVASKQAPTGAIMHTVYVSLYQAGGHNIKNWQYMLGHLAEHTMGRPAYTEREHVEQFVRSRPVPSNEAYVVADVLEKDILSGMGRGPEKKDAEGRPMLSLNKGAIALENVHEFVHSSGRFTIEEGRLKPLDDQQAPPSPK